MKIFLLKLVFWIRIAGFGANVDNFDDTAGGAGVIDIPDNTWFVGATFSRDDILVFDYVVSPYSNTLSSVLTIFSESSLENEIEITQGIDLIDIFHGYGWWLNV